MSEQLAYCVQVTSGSQCQHGKCVTARMETDIFFVIPASAAFFLRHLLHTPNIVSSNTFWLGLHPFRSGNQCKADWFRGIITCLPTISTFAVLRLSAYPHFAPHPSLYISVTVSERRAWSLSSRKASASILPWRTARRRRMTGIRERTVVDAQD